MSSPPGAASRRTFLRGAGLVAFAIAGGAGLSGCTSAVRELDAVGDDATPVRGGTLKVGTPWDIVPTNILTNTATTPALIGLVYESLIRYPNDRLEPQPLLAKSWSLAPDGLSLALDLRDDVTFHSGRPFTSADVEFALRTYADPKWSAQLKSTAAAITGYDTSAPHRIVLRFASPLGNIFDLLDTAPMLDRETIGQLATGDAFVGTGPFRFVDRIPNSQLTFERNDHYWVPDRPYLDRVQFSVVPDSQAQLNALRSGQIGLAHGLNPRDIENLAKRPGFKSITYDGAELQMYVGVNVQNPALADVRLRQAVAYALDRDRIIDEVYRGAGYALNVPWPKNSPAYDEARNTKYSRNLDKARELVAQVGKPPEIPLSYNTSVPAYGATAQIVQSNLAEVGIDVTLDPNDDATFVKKLIGGQFPGLWVTDHSWAQFVPSTLTVSAYPFNARKNASHYESPAYVAAADTAWKRTGGTDAAAVSAYRAVSDQLLDGLFLIEIGVRLNQVAASKRVHGVGWTKRRETLLTEAFVS
ncbi:peptide/nickel transport system substrate-binding protein [Nocardia transvalensis]|uniref:Peptide/nickel transport system substrate-binding protein n=1 Tax=Nocardia transvalensis TaxID=37333 RepID=A0A7W9PA57_9NOCA|nr:ABC transporter substrate-binding protein [Nocardia transvalensis]MBB5912260.1 peptide/nickel transport system substrate-binding protein [Nocardia transvalensis]